MLEQMRSGAKHPVVKFFFLILAGMFVLWGVGDVFRNGGGSAYVATVGKSGILAVDLDNMVRNEAQRYQEATGKTLSEEEISAMGIKQYAISQLVRDKLVTMRASDLNLVAGKQNIAKKIYENNVFFDDQGKFDKARFKKILSEHGFSEEKFVNSIRQESAIGDLVSSITVAAVVPKSMVDQVYKYRNEVRIADVFTLPATTISDVQEPVETDLVQFYQDNQAKFSLPEQRAVTFMTLNIDKIKHGLTFSEEELQALYQANLAQYATEASRDVSQYLFSKEEEAKSAYAKIAKGDIKEFAASKVELGNMTKSSAPDEVREALFSLKQGEVSQPIKSQLGWHIFIVNSISSAKTRSFAEVRKELEKDLAERKTSDEFAKLGNQIEDEFAAGKTMEDVAKKFDIAINKIPSLEQTATANLPDPAMLLPIAFNLDVGVPSPLTLLSDNSSYAILRVDSVTPKRIRALDEVKGMAIKLWKEQEKNKNLKDMATDIVSKLRSGEDAKAITSKMKLKVAADKKIKRTPSDDKGADVFPAEMERELFNLKKDGSYTAAYPDKNGNFLFARLTKVVITTPGSNKADVDNMRQQLEDEMRNDIMTQYINHLQSLYPVSLKSTSLTTTK